MYTSKFQKPDLLSVLRSPEPEDSAENTASNPDSDTSSAASSRFTPRSKTKNPPLPSKNILHSSLITVFLFTVLVFVCILVSYLIPSATTMIKSDTIVSQRNALSDIRSGMDLLRKNIVNEVQGIPKQYLLPVTNSPGMPYSSRNVSTYKDEKGIKHSVYSDHTITVDIWKEKGKINGSTHIASYAKVKISHPTQLRTSVSTSGYHNRSKTTVQAKKNNAIVAVNGDFFTLRKSGVIIKQGTYHKKTKSSKQTLFIDSNGDFHIMTSSEALNSGFLDNNTIYNSMLFGPALVIDGNLCSYTLRKDNIAAMHFYRNPRTGIGQLGELEYLLIVVDGRTGNSSGLTTNQFATLFYEAGCINAYNLDGGQSACMAYLGKLYNNVSNSGERLVSDILYFASAAPEETN